MANDTLSYLGTFIFIFFSAIFGGLVCRYLKLPMLLGYIVIGMLAGNIFPSIARTDYLIPIAVLAVWVLLNAWVLPRLGVPT